MSVKISEDQITSNSLKEKGFNLPLQTLVEGIDSTGNLFKEKTMLSYISHNGSSFWINTKVVLDCELRLTVDLPPQLSSDDELKLVIKGKVIFLEAPKNHNKGQRVSIKFENKYIIEPSK